MESTISIVDIAAIILVLTGVVHGFRQGVSPGFSWFCGSLVGLLAATLTYPLFARVINTSGDVDPTLLAFCSLMGSVLVAALTLVLIRSLLAQIGRLGTTLLLDRIGGAFAGLIQSSAIVILFFIALTSVGHPGLMKIFGEQSAIGRPIVALKTRLDRKMESDYDQAQNRMLQQREKRTDQRTQPR